MNEHFKEFLTQVRNPNLPIEKGVRDPLICLTESDEASTQIVDKEIGSILTKYGSALIDLHITDRQIYN